MTEISIVYLGLCVYFGCREISGAIKEAFRGHR